MELQYEITLDDLVTFNKYHIRHSPTCRRSYWWNLVGMIVAFVLVAVLVGALYGTPIATAIHLAILLPLSWPLWHLIYRVTVARRLRKLYREGENRGLAGIHLIRIDAEGLAGTSQAGESKLKWVIVERIVEDNNHLYIYVSAVSAIVIPKRAFQDEHHIQAFRDEARRLKAEGQAATQASEAGEPATR